jgi:hypothetical protein
MGFAANLNRLCQAAGDKAEIVVRKTALELQSNMVEPSPVDEGRFKNNWVASIGAVDTTNTHEPDKTGAGAIARTVATLEQWTPGQTINLTNSMPYAKKLEEGSSTQAPSGVVRLAVQAYGEALRKAAAELK